MRTQHAKVESDLHTSETERDWREGEERERVEREREVAGERLERWGEGK